MATEIIRFQFRRGTAAEWAAANPVLAPGEPGVETDTGKQKFGNGVAAWSALPYAASGPQGSAGVADDTSVAALVADPTSQTATELSATYASGNVHFIVSDTAPAETTVNGKPVVWIDTSATPTADTTAPSAVTGLTAGTATTTTVPLSWTAAMDNVGIAGYEYSTNGTTYTSTGSTGTSYTVTGLTQGTAYTLYVRAFDAAGNRGPAASVAKTTAASTDTTAPTAPTNLAGTAGSTTMDLSWTASTDAVGVTGYRVSKDNGATWITSSVTGTTYQVTGLTAETSYTFAVAARDAAGNWSTNATLTKSTTAAPVLTTYVHDTFTRADGSLGTAAMDSGQAWSGSTTNATITSNRLAPTTSSVYVSHGRSGNLVLDFDVTLPAQTCDVRLSAKSPAGLIGDSLGIIIKNDGAKVYVGWVGVAPATTTFNNNNGTNGWAHVPDATVGTVTSRVVKWSISGDTIIVSIAGTRVLEATLSSTQATTFQSAAYLAIDAAPANIATVDNVKVSA